MLLIINLFLIYSSIAIAQINYEKVLFEIPTGPKIFQQKNECIVNNRLINEFEIIKGFNGHDVKLSIVSENTAQELFKVTQQMNLAVESINSGCDSRALLINYKLEEMGISSGKVFSTGNIKIPEIGANWDFHVAPIIAVSLNGQVVHYVLDPILFKSAVPLTLWLALLKNAPSSRVDETFYTSGYHFSKRSRKWFLNEYDIGDINEAKNRIKYLNENH